MHVHSVDNESLLRETDGGVQRCFPGCGDHMGSADDEFRSAGCDADCERVATSRCVLSQFSLNTFEICAPWLFSTLNEGGPEHSKAFIICGNLIGKSEICAARSLFEALCVRKGEFYLPNSFLQLPEISETISALCTVSL